jgi:hypothetical protein
MKQAAWTLLFLCLLAFTTSTGSYSGPFHRDTIPSVDTIKLDTLALLSQIQSVADSFAHVAVKKIDSVVSVPRMYVKKVDIERRVTGEFFAWIKIYKSQNGVGQYDTTIVVEIPCQ